MNPLRHALPVLLLLSSGSFSLAAEEELLDFEKLAPADRAIAAAVSARNIPGAVLRIERGEKIYEKSFGSRSLTPRKEGMTPDTIFDAASLTKVIATTSCVMQLVEQGQLSADDPVQKYLPEFTGDPNKARVTIRHLLTHTSGLGAGIRRAYEWEGYENGIILASAEPSVSDAGSSYRYSDINFILLGEIVHRVSGKRLDQYVADHLFGPLGMDDSGFLPDPEKLARIAPTTRMNDGSVLRGIVHDPTARRMEGVAGHAGLFTTAADLGRFSRMIFAGGKLDGRRVLKETSVSSMTSVQSPDTVDVRRGFGWDIDSPYASPRGELFPVGSFGHTGWTGTSIWIDPFSQTSVVLLSNRNHPTESGKVSRLRAKVGTLAAQAVGDFDFDSVEVSLQPVSIKTAEADAAPVRNGIDVASADGFKILDGLNVALITNHTGVNLQGTPTIDLMHKATNFKLVSLFSPEHGIRGTEDNSAIKDGIDKKTGLKINSLYSGEKRKPNQAQLRDLDAMVFDIQDIGCRFYTYISTMGNCMEAAEEAGIKFIVFDRINPIGGSAVDGPVLKGKRSFVGFHEIPVRHGMTVGELARLFQAERFPKLELAVVPVEGWRRELYQDQTTVRWINPSPNMRSLTAATLYPGVGLLEFTNLSVGRGTRMPFELVGAPYIDENDFSQALNEARLPGIVFVPVRFKPTTSVFGGKECGGVRLVLRDRTKFSSIDLGITMARTLRRLYRDDWQTTNLDKLLVHPPTASAILEDEPLEEIRKLWSEDREIFSGKRESALLY